MKFLFMEKRYMKKFNHILGIIGLLLVIYGVMSAILYSNVTWYSYFVIGGPLFFGYLNYKFKNESLLQIDKQKLFKTYILYFLAGLITELIGRFSLNLWEYPYFTTTNQIVHLFLIIYPIGFFFIYETFVFIRGIIKSFNLTIIITTIFHAFLNELPNTFIWTWRYTIPYVTFEILQINIVVIVGWVVLVIIPLITKRILK